MSFMFPLKQLVRQEAKYLERTGVRIPPSLRSAIERADGTSEILMALYGKLCRLPRGRSPYFRQSSLPEIQAARPQAKGGRPQRLTRAALADRIAGGWLGRAAGCILGKPLECCLTLEEIRTLLGRDWPIADYVRYRFARKICLQKKPSLHPGVTRPCSREHVAFAMQDDDLNYTLLNLILLERKGRDFSTEDVGAVWSEHLPPACTWGAETAAFLNYLNGIPIGDVSSHLNPFREQIGAQIRADMFGYVCPGDPEQAAALAWRDATFSHVAEGVYGAMFFAAAIAAAFTACDINQVLDAGLAQIPENCHTATLIRRAWRWHADGLAWEEVYARIKAETADMGMGDTVNNAAYVINALLAGAGDFGRTIAVAVMQGHDTDCNGATAGSVLGVMLGRRRLPARWIAPLNDRIKTSLKGYSEGRISELAKRTAKVAWAHGGT